MNHFLDYLNRNSGEIAMINIIGYFLTFMTYVPQLLLLLSLVIAVLTIIEKLRNFNKRK